MTAPARRPDAGAGEPATAGRHGGERVDVLARIDVALVRAHNPGPMTLEGTNSYVVGRDPCWIVDPGPDLPEHLDAVAAEAARRGGAAGLLLTHGHGDHADGAPGLVARTGAPVLGLAEGERAGPLTALATPGHSSDHLAYLHDQRACFTGDAVLGRGSVFVAPEPQALARYLAAIERLRALDLELLLPGHGPLVTDPRAKLDEVLAHRRDRERRLVAALAAGLRSRDELLDAAWSEVPAVLRPAAAVTLQAHLLKLEGEGRLPPGAGAGPAPSPPSAA